MSKQKETQKEEEKDPAHALDFVLETTFPDATNLFASHAMTITPGGDFLVAIDTNVLILPYKIDAEDLSALSTTYRTLSQEKKLFLPARASREFIKHRDSKLAAVVVGLNDRISRLEPPKAKLSPILEGVEGYDELSELATAASDAVTAYRKALRSLIGKIKQWRGDDPVSMLYAEVFNSENIIEAPGEQADLRAEWAVRSLAKLPPGYKDSAKEDSGIGDFLIWKSLLEIGRTRKMDLVFLTLDDKSDWAVRAGNEAIYPRPELVDEYRRASGGKSIHLSHLGEFLKRMDVSETVVAKVKAAETTERSQEPTSQSTSGDFLEWIDDTSASAGLQKMRSAFSKRHAAAYKRTSTPRFSVGPTPGPIAMIDVPLAAGLIGFRHGHGAMLVAGDPSVRLSNLGDLPSGMVMDLTDLNFDEHISVSMDDVLVISNGSDFFQVLHIFDAEESGEYLTLYARANLSRRPNPIIVP
jgi:hypothetical protein